MAVAYLETQIDADERWLAADQRVTVAAPGGDLMAVGTCGRCHDETQYPIDLEPVKVAEVSAALRVSLNVTRMFRCCRARPHANWPVNVYTGCGAHWFAWVTGDPGHYALSPAPAQFIPGAVAVEEAKGAQAGLVQQTAEKWLEAITALLALFSVGDSALTESSVAALSTAWKIAAAIAAGLAVAFGAYVAEWARTGDALSGAPSPDPTGPGVGSNKILRGGSWFDIPYHCRTANHFYADPILAAANRGILPVRASKRCSGPKLASEPGWDLRTEDMLERN